MRHLCLCSLLIFCLVPTLIFSQRVESALKFYPGNAADIHFVGRVDYSFQHQPRFWNAGVYFQFRFRGSRCQVDLIDQQLYGWHNYLEIVVDGKTPYRISTWSRDNVINIGDSDKLKEGVHTVLICKNTESSIGYLQLKGISCQKLLPFKPRFNRKIECIGNSITCGTGSDQSVIPCGKGLWQDQHNAYMSYGPSTARMLKADWMLTSYSGIGLMHSCCGLKYVMPQVFDKIVIAKDSLKWDFNAYRPDVLTICLGQNDGIADSAEFCGAYLRFLCQLRKCYPKTTLICLSSPMADSLLNLTLHRYLSSVVKAIRKQGDADVYACFFSRRYHNGCDEHPDMREHQLIAKQLSQFIRKIKRW